MTDSLCTFAARMRPSGGALARIAATLSSHGVRALSYSAPNGDRGAAVVRVQVPQAEAARVRARLHRVVDVLDVLDVLDVADTTEATSVSGPPVPPESVRPAGVPAVTRPAAVTPPAAPADALVGAS